LRVVQEAERLADDRGLENLTLAAIAPRLGVQIPSLYKHVKGMDALLRAMSTRAKHEMADVLARAATGKAGAESVAAVAGAWRAWAKEHPGRYAAAVRQPDAGDTKDAEASVDLMNIVIAALSGYRLRDDDAIHAVRILRANLHGFVSTELADGFGLSAKVEETFDLLVGALVQTLSTWPPSPVELPCSSE
jgi:AcrR family transcriptional regulator